MKRMILVFSVILCSCMVEPGYQEDIMISGNAIEAMVYKKTDSVLNVLEPRRYRSGAPYGGMQEILAGYVADGYTLFAGPTSGDIDLSGQSAGKYLVYWTSTPTGTVNVVANTITATSGTHESVIIFGGILASSTNHKITGYVSGTFNFTSAYDFQSILQFVGVEVSQPTLSAARTIIQSDFSMCQFNCPSGSGYLFKTINCVFSNCNIKHDSAAPVELSYPYDAVFENNFVYRTVTGLTTFKIYHNTPNDLILKNCLFYNMSDYLLTVTTGYLGYLQNCAFIDSYITVSAGATGSQMSYFSTLGCQIGDLRGNYSETPLRETQKFIFGVPEIDFTSTVDFADFVSLTCDISRTDEADSRLFGFGYENFYEVQFTTLVPDELKAGLGDGYYWFIRRRDFEEDLAGKTIYNLGLFAAGGHTTTFDFSSDENFLILAEDSSGNQAVLIWYSNQLYPTVYSDTWDATDYEILNCFQIWEAESRSNLRNTFRNYNGSSYKGITDSPMTGQIRFNNLDREVLIRV